MQGRTGQNQTPKIILPPTTSDVSPPPPSKSGSTTKTTTKTNVSVTPSQVSVTVETTPETKNTNPYSRLRCYNIAMAIFHTTFVVVTLSVGKLDLALNLWEYQMGLNNDTEIDSFLAPVVKPSTISIPLTITTAFFFMLSAFFHFGNGLVWNSCYNRFLDQKMVPSRWIEYFFSATTMILTISYPAGIVQFTELVAIGSLIATTMLFGHFTEVISRPSPDSDTWTLPLWSRLSPHLLGYIPQLAAWFIIMYTFYGAGNGERGPPDFVYAIVWLQLALFFSFGFIQLVVLCRPPSKYVQGEYAYQTLSLVAKGLLGIMLLTNVLFLSNFECINEDIRERNPELC